MTLRHILLWKKEWSSTTFCCSDFDLVSKNLQARSLPVVSPPDLVWPNSILSTWDYLICRRGKTDIGREAENVEQKSIVIDNLVISEKKDTLRQVLQQVFPLLPFLNLLLIKGNTFLLRSALFSADSTWDLQMTIVTVPKNKQVIAEAYATMEFPKEVGTGLLPVVWKNSWRRTEPIPDVYMLIKPKASPSVANP